MKLRLLASFAAVLFASTASAQPLAFESAAELSSSVLATLRYDGGFINRQHIELQAPVELKKFKVQIPSFCGDVEILEAGTVTEGIEDVAEATDAEGVFVVNGGDGMRVGQIFLTLNGPDAASCTIPVLDVSDDGDTNGPARCDVDVAGTNYLADNSFPMTAGWTPATVRRFIAGSGWSAPLRVDGLQPIRLNQTAGTCHSYATIKYDRRACDGNIVADSRQAVLVGESAAGDQVTRLFAFLSNTSHWNLCIRFAGDILFNRVAN